MRRWFLLHLSPVSKVQGDQRIQSPWPFRVLSVWVPVREPEHVTCSSFNCVSFSLQSPHQLPNSISSELWSTYTLTSKISLAQSLLVKSWLTSNKCHWPGAPPLLLQVVCLTPWCHLCQIKSHIVDFKLFQILLVHVFSQHTPFITIQHFSTLALF